jgi:hypothetical protein
MIGLSVISRYIASESRDGKDFPEHEHPVARSFGFVIEIERSGVTPISLESFF